MNDDLTELRVRTGALDLKPIVRREGVGVYEAATPSGRAFVKITDNKAAFEMECELLKALGTFPLVPCVVNTMSWDNQYVVVLSALEGERLDHRLADAPRSVRIDLLNSVGAALGELHRALTPARLSEMKFWRTRDKEPLAWGFSWNSQLRAMVSKWSTRLNRAASDFPEYDAHRVELLEYCGRLREPKHLRLIHCDYIGRNILVNAANHVSGILDFEAARVGDAAYDLAKLVWVNMDFEDIDLRQAVLTAWERSYGETVPQREFLGYVGVQCLAAIAWTDTHEAQDDGARFRSTAIRTLRAAVRGLRSA